MTNKIKCDGLSDCINSEGSYECVCTQGAEMADGICFDIDECGSSIHQCHSEAICTNIEGR